MSCELQLALSSISGNYCPGACWPIYCDAASKVTSGSFKACPSSATCQSVTWRCPDTGVCLGTCKLDTRSPSTQPNLHTTATATITVA